MTEQPFMRPDGPTAAAVRAKLPTTNPLNDPAPALLELARAVDRLREEFQTHGHGFTSGHGHGTPADHGRVAGSTEPGVLQRRRECTCPAGQFHADSCDWARGQLDQVARMLFGHEILGPDVTP